MKPIIFVIACINFAGLYGCSTPNNGYDWSPGEEIKTDSSGEVVAPEAIVLPQEDIDAINKL
ncbi:hypothetical protein L4D09_10820 [Photobacterium makurazakiensis]|uniref:hypothetical protein n=1 Tax=Photobacterium makurazakiensis TaxID=2910234 RepID=UPI003D097024